MKITLVRHGETEENKHKIVQDPLSGKLTEKGEWQAKKLAKKLSSEKFDVIFCSDSDRTRKTAEEIMEYHKTPIKYASELREINRGEFIGLPAGELKRELKKSGKSIAEFKPKGAESPIEQQERVRIFLNKLTEKNKNKHILLVTHGGVCRCIWNICNKTIPHKDNGDKNKMETGSLSKFECINNQLMIVSYNDTEHLK